VKAKAPLLLGLALGGLAVSALLTHTLLFRQVVQGNTDLTRRIPERLGKWSKVADSPVSESEIRGLETADVLKRVYGDGETYVELVVAYIAHSSRKSAHAQEACLRGAGALVGRIETRRLEKAPVLAKSISLDLHDQKQQVYYWYKIGDVHTASYLSSSLKMFLGGLAGSRAQGASLVRLLTPVRKGEPQAGVDARLEDFAAELVPELGKHLP
jgi:EpsI family protein